MSQKKKKEEGTFSRYLKWTILLALVFSAGLIAGHRLLKTDAVPPLVALSMTRQGPIEVTSVRERAEVMKPEFSFYNRLTGGAVVEAEIPLAPVERIVRASGLKLAEPTVSEPLEVTVSPTTVEPSKVKEVSIQAVVSQPREVAPPEMEVVEHVEIEAQKEVESVDPAPTQVEIETESVREVAVLQPKVAPADEASVVVPRFTLQAGTHTSRAAATRELERYRAQGLDAHLITVEVNGEKFYRVRIGRFADTEEVDSFRASLEAEKGLSTIVVPL